MKKIVCYIDMLGRGGAQRVMSNLVTHFDALGHHVLLVNDFIRDENLPHYEVPSTVERLFLRKKRSGIPGLKNIQRIVALRKILIKEKPDLVLSFLGSPNITALIASLGLKTKIVVSVRNDPQKEYGTNIFKKWLVCKLFRRANGCVFQTEDATKYFENEIRLHSTIILNPVADRFFNVERESNVHNIVTCGRFEPQKNHKLLIDAYNELPESLQKDKLIIYGDGPLKDETIEYCKKLGLVGKVLMPGNVSDVPEKLAEAKMFVLSSNYEGLPNALMEAMAVGVPCISTDCPCGGPRTLIQNNLQGILVPCNDIDALSSNMKKMLQDENLRDTMGHAAQKRSRDFLPDTVYAKWDSFVNLIMEKK